MFAGETRIKLESSAKRDRVLEAGASGKELMHRLKRSGPRWEPWGTPAVMGKGSERVWPMQTQILRSLMKSFTQEQSSVSQCHSWRCRTSYMYFGPNIPVKNEATCTCTVGTRYE